MKRIGRLKARIRSIAQTRHFKPKNGFTVLISRVKNQIDYHTRDSFTFKHLPKPESLAAAADATKVCESVKPFPDRKSQTLSDAESVCDDHIL